MKRQHPTDPNLFWCPNCEEWVSSDHFYKEKRHTDGMGSCKIFARIRVNAYRNTHKDEIKEKRKPYFEARRVSGEKAAYDKKWRRENRERKRKTDREWHIKNKESTNKQQYERIRNNSDLWARQLKRCRQTNERLTDSVVRGNIWKSLKIKHPSMQLMDVYREMVIMKRTLRQFKQWRKENENESNHTDVHGKQFTDEENHEGRV